MGKNFILALDQGTTSSRAIVFDLSGTVLASASEVFPQIYPQAGWVEHNPGVIWETQFNTALSAIQQARIRPADIAAVGIANQRETTLIWERATGRPIYNAIVWQCRRTADACEALAIEGWQDEIRNRTGLVLDAYFSATKVKWLLDHVEHGYERAARGELCFGTVDTWLLYKLTGEHATDYSNASRTMLFNIHDLAWDEVLLKGLDIPREVLPTVRPSSGFYGMTTLFGSEIPVMALCGDQQSALFGQAGFAPGDCKNTYGTGCFVLMNTGTQPVESRAGLITTIAWGQNGMVEYALEGSVFIGGAVVQWLRDELGLIQSAAESEALAAQVDDCNGVRVVPAFVGLGAPHWDMHARGIITGLTRGANRSHIVRAALESISFQSADVLRSMETDSGMTVSRLRVDGGAAANNLLMQHQADVLGIPVLRGQTIETTALGVAFLAGLAAGCWRSRDDIGHVWRLEREFVPQWDATRREVEMAGWNRALRQARMGY